MTKKTIVFLVAVIFVGTSLMGLTSANAQCRSCCNSCQSAYDAAVGGSVPSDDDFWRSLETPPEYDPEGLNCVVEALVAFGGCCAVSNCLTNETYFYLCVGWALDVYYKCEAQYRAALNSCQASCPCCSGC